MKHKMASTQDLLKKQEEEEEEERRQQEPSMTMAMLAAEAAAEAATRSEKIRRKVLENDGVMEREVQSDEEEGERDGRRGRRKRGERGERENSHVSSRGERAARDGGSSAHCHTHRDKKSNGIPTNHLTTPFPDTPLSTTPPSSAHDQSLSSSGHAPPLVDMPRPLHETPPTSEANSDYYSRLVRTATS